MIYIQRLWPDGRICGRSVGYGQRLTYCGLRYGLRGALHYHDHDGHYTSVVCRGNKYYHCNDSSIKSLTRAEAFSPYTYGDTNTVQTLVYSRLSN